MNDSQQLIDKFATIKRRLRSDLAGVMSDDDITKLLGEAEELSTQFAESVAHKLMRLPSENAPDIPHEMSQAERAAWGGLVQAMQLAHKTSLDAGWYNDPATGQPIQRNFGEVVALMHSELSEALEADRTSAKDDKLPHRDGREVEFADCLIRIFDTAAALGLDLAGAFIEKNRFNIVRADHKRAARAAAGGKKY